MRGNRADRKSMQDRKNDARFPGSNALDVEASPPKKRAFPVYQEASSSNMHKPADEQRLRTLSFFVLKGTDPSAVAC